jgi:hypothetical protein
MPTRTISAAGGNWNSTSTWVGGVVPIANDDILGLSTSGNLTINVATTNMLFFNLSNYLGTLTLNQAMNINGGVGNTTTFSPTMSFATATSYSDTNGICFNNTSTAHSIRTNGKKLPWVASLKGGGANTLTLLDDLNCETLSIGFGNANTVINGTFSINLNHFNRSGGGGGSTGLINSSTSVLNFVGPTASYRASSIGQNNPVCISSINVRIDVGSTGTFSTFTPFGLAGSSTATTYTWVSGNLGGTKELILFDINNASFTARLDFAGSGTWSKIYYNDITTGAFDRRLELLSNLFFDSLEASPAIPAYTATARRALTLSGSGSLKGGRIVAVPYVGQIVGAGAPIATLGSPTYSSPMIRLNPGATTPHVLSDIKVMGSESGIEFRNSNNQISKNALIASATASVRARLNFTGSSDKTSFWVQYTDIDASGGNMIYNFGGSQSNSLNIGTASFGGGSATTAFTFVN